MYVFTLSLWDFGWGLIYFDQFIYLSGESICHKHIEHIKANAWQRIHVMRHLKFIPDRKSLQTIYFSFIRQMRMLFGYESNELEKNGDVNYVKLHD